ncbi:MAG: PQQ-binding-like beta-propeller repeat protein [Planctomycetes bacterium]|nr:PQQ-binding-like beta-propeller repeat protein [Planctomycetota bacterium]
MGRLHRAGVAEYQLYDPTVQVMALLMDALPVVVTAWVLWLRLTGRLAWPVRRAGLLAVFVLCWGYLALYRFDGVDGSFSAEMSWRWTPTKEAAFLAARAKDQPAKSPEPAAATAPPLALQPGDWPAFRGAGRDSKLAGVRIDTNWQAQPPKELWRKRVGPGWSSFCALGGRIFTQEQWGEEEAVVCYDAGTGAQLWAHTDKARFTEIIAGPGPRATPTFHEGKLFVLGAAGKLNALDAQTGKAVWTQDIAADSGTKVPVWGFCSSPLVAAGVVTVFPGGEEGKAMLGYDAATGKLLWSSGKGRVTYCSTQLAKIGENEQILISTEFGLTGFEPASGKVLWNFEWLLKDEMARVVQPTVLEDGDLVIGTGFGMGIKRVHVAQENGAWTAKEVWSSRGLSPYYNDSVAHAGCLFGFNANFLACVSASDGKEKWHVQGYGNGQILLLADQGLLLVLTEKGAVALVEAKPDGCHEIARFQALQGKTWNHPVLAHGKLFVRNGEEMACFELKPAEQPGASK